MKKYIFVLITILILTGCGQTPNGHKKPPANDTTNADITIGFRGVQNSERLDQFIENVQKGAADKIRLIQHTIEGAPIYQLLDFDGKDLTYTMDNTHDKFSSNDDRKKFTYKCQRINHEETNTFTKYYLEGCPVLQNGVLFTISHDVNMEDYFAFQLKYGKNTIDTNHHEIRNELPDGNVVVGKDFELPNHVMNNIYKAMIFTNYMGEKHFSNVCQSSSAVKYELKVWINSGQRTYKWVDCDQSSDNKQMTQLAKNIINIVQETSEYKRMVKQ